MVNPRGTDPPRPGGSTPMSEEGRQNPFPEVPHLNFWLVFESLPNACLLLAPDAGRYTTIAGNDARLPAATARREDVVGRPVCQVFRDEPARSP